MGLTHMIMCITVTAERGIFSNVYSSVMNKRIVAELHLQEISI